ncbi:PLP-dependent aminotransferase family protein [Williamsia sp.]|uniref:aminotransferase-like domain-containing protein n=1 Tax=Williamsia sp. TaxID=1872085 RepID=UPI001A30FBE7|nr:PLP-dependent aminotransferase family protein [Williamsia sp.]MBJ7288177.1 PLP-dependent aminotransferase family protein [Williamsia sp.]
MSAPVVTPSAALSNVRGSAIRDLLSLTERPDVLSMAGGLPATELIPQERIALAAQRAVGDRDLLQYTVSAGLRECRDAVARHEGVDTPEHVLITHGSQQALFLLAHALVDPGDLVVVDDPVYVGALQVFQSVRADVRGLPLTARGIDTDLLEQWCADGARPTIVHTVSSFHNPGGVTADDGRRAHLARLAERYGFWIIDDNPYGQLRFRGTEPTPWRRFGDRVISLGTVSKILAPALRVGWCVAPPPVIALVERLRQGADLCGSTFTQAMVADLLTDRAWLDGHIDVIRDAYRSRAMALVEALTTHLGSAAEFTRPEGGMFCWVRLPGVDTSALLDTAVAHGVAYVPGSAFAVSRDAGDCLRLSFATLAPADIDRAVTRLARALG